MSQRTIAVVDGNSLLHRAFHALPESMTAPDGRPTNAAFGFVSMLVKLVADLGPDGVVVAFDCGKPAFRIQALEQYKVHRPPTAESLRSQFPMVKQLLAAMEIPTVELEGWEGDDVLGTLAVRGARAGMRVLLVTGDRDAFQLVNDDVQVVTTRKGITDIKIMGPADVIERYGVTPEQVPDYLGLKGDTSDNIPGVPGVGEKTAAKLLQQYGTLEAVIDAARAGEIKGKVGENLVSHVGEAHASRTVATIRCDVPVEVDLETVSFGDWDDVVLARAFGELRFTSLLDRALALKAGGGTARQHAAEAPRPAPAPDGDAATRDRTATSSSTASPACDDLGCLTGPEAVAASGRWIAGSAGWLGVAFGSGGDCLFADAREMAVAGPDAIAVFEGDAVDTVLSELLTGARLAVADAKAVLQELCPADEALPCDSSVLGLDPVRLFDVGIAAYLLESNRSSYEVSGLHADYIGAPLPAADEGHSDAAVNAHATARLAVTLEQQLVDDESIGVFRGIEMPLVPLLARMERVGVGLDTVVLEELAHETHSAIDALRTQIHELAGVEFTIDSPKQLSEVLFDKLGLPPGKRTKTGLSTDASVLATLVPLHPIAEKIVSYRELTKLTSTYIEALPRLLGGDGRLHTSFNQTVAATGRLSSSNPNLQNIPVRTEFGRKIRAAFVPATSGDVMVSADYSQIELRILAHLSGDRGLIEAFTSGADFHAATAARVFGVEVADVEPGMRAKAKAVNFGIVYGQTAHGLGTTLKIPNPEAQAMIDRYYAAYPRVREYLDETVAEAHRVGFAVTMFGRKRRIPELMSGNYNLRGFGERTAMNHPMQGSAADIMKLAMIEVDRRVRGEGFAARMVLQVHDELVFEAPADEVERLSATVVEAMSGISDLAVPLEVSVASGVNWAEAK